MPFMTSTASAIKGTALGLTKLAASIMGRPERDNASINAILASVENACGWFCNPSRGATSTMRTGLGSAVDAIVPHRGFTVDDAGAQILLDQGWFPLGGRVIPAATGEIERDADGGVEPQRPLAF